MKWYLARKVELYPFYVVLVNDGYVRRKSKNVKWNYKNTMFYFKDCYETSFRAEKDIKSLKKYLEKNFNSKFVKNVGKEIKSNADRLFRIAKISFKNKESLKKHFEEFCSAYSGLFVSFQLPHEAQTLLPELDRKLLINFGMARDYAARRYGRVDQIIKNRLGKVLGLPKDKALNLLPNEIKDYLADGSLPKDFHERKTCLILTKNSRTKIYWNKKADNIFKKEYAKKKAGKVVNIHGHVAHPGKVRGKVHLALNEEDFMKMLENCILVCSMTRYNIVKLLSKVKAIVTDQGGITSHASIIAREMRIPCIVGTNNATEILKTGDYVEVHATEGFVRILKRKK